MVQPIGRIKCTLANWTGVAYKLPRTELDKCTERDDLRQSGVYFLFGASDQTGESVVYIGQAGSRKNGEGILYRLQEHKRNPDKDYWTEAVVFTTSNNSFGPTEISYLENRFCNMASAAKRYIVKNGNDPNSGHITEEKGSELEEFIDNARIVMGTLGHKVFEPLLQNTAISYLSKNDETTDEQIFQISRSGTDTSDSPVARKAHAKHAFLSMAGLTSPGVELSIPISPPLILLMIEGHYHKLEASLDRTWQEMNSQNVQHYNARCIYQSHRFVFSSNNDFKFLQELAKKDPQVLMNGMQDVTLWGGKTYKARKL